MSYKQYFLYIITNSTNKTFYVGITNNLEKRIYQHKEKLMEGFSKKYNCSRLIYFEESNDVYEALLREKQIKKYPRKWKINMINRYNPKWKDLSSGWY